MLAALIPALGPIVEKLVGLIPDPNARAKAAAEAHAQLVTILSSADMAQIEVNREEAKSASIFVAGWRPMIGWVCALSLAYQYLGRAILTAIFDAAGWRMPYLPGLDEHLWELMFAMLGIGGLRTIEKMSGKTK
jgi:hypothetical protein